MFVLENWGVGGSALQVFCRLGKRELFRCTFYGMTVFLCHCTLILRRHSPSLGPAHPICEPHTTAEPLVLIFVTFTPSMNGGKNCTKQDWGGAAAFSYCVNVLWARTYCSYYLCRVFKEVFGALVPHHWREENEFLLLRFLKNAQ